MQLRPYVELVRSDLAAIASVGDDRAAEVAERLGGALESSLALRMLDALTEAALEVGAQLPAGQVDVRLAGRDAELVYVDDAEGVRPVVEDDGMAARITLRLPESLKKEIDAAAAHEHVSVNTWLVRELARAVAAPPRRHTGKRLTGFAET
jgi:hypothetical protein